MRASSVHLRLSAVLGASCLLAAPAAGMAQGAPPPAPSATALRVCADPENLPFSDDKGQGLENRIAQILGDDLNLRVEYTWQSQRRGFLRRSLSAGVCDVVVGVPPGLPGVITTRPYYRSSYVFLSRRELALAPLTLDDPSLRTRRIGVHALGMEGANTPAAAALAVRGIVDKVQGYPVWGDDQNGPTAGLLVDAVAKGEVDVAIVWGPFAGYFGKAYAAQLAVTPITADACLPEMAFAYDISVGVRARDTALRDRLQAALDRHPKEIAAALHDFAVPLVPAPPAQSNTPIPVGAPAPVSQSTGASSCASRPS